MERIEIKEEIQSLSPSALVELFVLDATMFENGAIYHFHSGLSQTNQPIVWQGQSYNPIPMEVEGFEMSTQGALPRPQLRIANVGGFLSAIVINMDDLIGAKLTRKRTFARYLDAVNFPSGNEHANPDQHFQDELWFIDRKKVENKDQVEWELASAFDLEGIKLPLRQIVKSTCCWQYRSAECGFTGSYFDINDEPTDDINADTCPKRLSSCKARHGTEKALPFGGFPGAERGD